MKIFIAIPTYGSIPMPFVYSILDLLWGKLPFNYQLKFVNGESLVSRARNRLAADFLESDCTHLLFIDSDILFTSRDIEKLASRKKDIVGGLYTAKKADEVLWCANTFEGQDVKPDKDGLIKLRFLATGFLMISRVVFNKMIKADKTIAYRSDLTATRNRKEYDFFKVGVKDNRYLSEDWWFCETAGELGFDVFADSDVILQHYGTAAYPLIRMDAPPITNQPQTIKDLPPQLAVAK